MAQDELGDRQGVTQVSCKHLPQETRNPEPFQFESRITSASATTRAALVLILISTPCTFAITTCDLVVTISVRAVALILCSTVLPTVCDSLSCSASFSIHSAISCFVGGAFFGDVHACVCKHVCIHEMIGCT